MRKSNAFWTFAGAFTAVLAYGYIERAILRAWGAMPNLAHGQLVTEAHLDLFRTNLEHLASLLSGTDALSSLTAGDVLSGVAEVEVGTYTGDGAGSAGSGGQVVAMSGSWTPDIVLAVELAQAQVRMGHRTNLNTTAGWTNIGAGTFTVTDGGSNLNPNTSGTSYVYVAMRLKEAS